MDRETVKIANRDYSPEEIIGLLKGHGLLPKLIQKQTELELYRTIKPSEEEQIAYQQRFLRRKGINTSEDLDQWLNKNLISEPELSSRLFRALQLEKLKQEKFDSVVDQVFLERKASLDMVMYSIIRCKERAKAHEIYTRIEEEEDTFADLASEFSEGQEQKVNGLIGPIELGRINPEIAERLRISKCGQMWAPFEQNGWWVLIRLEKNLPAQLDEAMRKRIINEKYESWIRGEVIEQMKEIELITTNKKETDLANGENNEQKDDENISRETKDKKDRGIRNWLKSQFQ